LQALAGLKERCGTMQEILADRYKLIRKEFQDPLRTVYEAFDQTENIPVTVEVLDEENKPRFPRQAAAFQKGRGGDRRSGSPESDPDPCIGGIHGAGLPGTCCAKAASSWGVESRGSAGGGADDSAAH
jgi:hypothetical protein